MLNLMVTVSDLGRGEDINKYMVVKADDNGICEPKTLLGYIFCEKK